MIPPVLAEAIVHERVDSLHEHPANPRQADVGAIIEAITTNGYIVPVIAQASSRLVIDGNHRLQAARQLGMESIPVVWVDVNDDTALRHLLAANRLNDLASYDDGALSALLMDLSTSTELGLAGSGWDGDALDSLIADLNVTDTPPPPSDVDDPESQVTAVEHTCPACGHVWTERPKKRGLFRR